MKHQNVDLTKFESGILVGALVVNATKKMSGRTKAKGEPFTMSRTQVLVGDRFGELIEYSRVENADHRIFEPGKVIVSARAIEKDPKNPAILRVSLSDAAQGASDDVI